MDREDVDVDPTAESSSDDGGNPTLIYVTIAAVVAMALISAVACYKARAQPQPRHAAHAAASVGSVASVSSSIGNLSMQSVASNMSQYGGGGGGYRYGYY